MPLKEWNDENGQTKTCIVFDSMFGTSMNRPAIALIDMAENILVINNNNDDLGFVTKYDKNSNFISSFPVAYTNIQGAAIDSNDNIYISSSAGANILKYKSSGEYLGIFANLGGNTIAGVAIDESDNVYVPIIDKIYIYNPNGTTKNILSTIAGDTGLIALDKSGNIYLTVNNGTPVSVMVYDQNGNLKQLFGAAGTGNGQFQNPTGIAVDDIGRIYVADRNNHRVQVFTSEGNYITQMGTGTAGTGSGEFNEPWGITIDRFGSIYIGDGFGGNNRVQKFRWK